MTHRGRSPRRTVPVRGLPAVAAAAAVGAWWATVAVLDIDPFFLPSPADTAAAMARLPGHLLRQAWATILVTLTGFGIAAATGLTAAAVMAASRHVQAAVMPLLVAANAVPKIAVAPLLIAWLGFGNLPKIVMVAAVSVFPIVIATASGLASTPTDLAELAASLSATRWQTFTKIRLPWAAPQIFVGLKVSAMLAVIGAVVAEIIQPDRGLGAVVVQAGTSADTPLAFAAIALLAAVSVGLYHGLAAAERLLLPWAPAHHSE